MRDDILAHSKNKCSLQLYLKNCFPALRLKGLISSVYTRYADNLVISSNTATTSFK